MAKTETRRLLLEAAAAVVAEKGLGKASLADIVERAGLTTGAVYSNFRSKEALLMEVVNEQLRPLDLPDPDQMTPGREAETLIDLARAAAIFTDREESRSVILLQIELYLQALRDPAVREEMRVENEATARSLAAVLRRIKAPPAQRRPPTLEQLAEVFYATLQGLQQHRLIFPSAVPDEVFDWWVRLLLSQAAGATARRPSRT